MYEGVVIGTGDVTTAGAAAGNVIPGCGGATATGDDKTGGATTLAPGAGMGINLPAAGGLNSARSSSVNDC